MYQYQPTCRHVAAKLLEKDCSVTALKPITHHGATDWRRKPTPICDACAIVDYVVVIIVRCQLLELNKTL